MLRKGTNVLALELHRPPTLETQLKAKCRSDAQYYAKWGRMCFQGATLTAPASPAIVPNVSRPAGLRVWNHSAMSVVDPAEYADPNEPVGTMRIVGCRNGAFSGQVAAGSTEALKGLKAEASALKGPGGVEIPASAIQVRWPRPIRAVAGNDFGYESLEVTPPAEVPAAGGTALQPIYVTVNVPKDAKPGDYAGKLSVSAGAAPVEVPVAVSLVMAGAVPSGESALAMPKSRTWTERPMPVSSTAMLEGLMSRWMILCSWAYSSAWAMGSRRRTASCQGMGVPNNCLRVPPGR
jgi:hypothetical protein